MDVTIPSIVGAFIVALATVLIARWLHWKRTTFYLLILPACVCGSFAGIEIAMYFLQ